MKLRLLIPTLAITLVAIQQARADEILKTETIKQTVAMSTYDLHCDLRPGFNAKKPTVSTLSKTGYLHGEDKLVLLEHDTVGQSGCDMKALSKIVKQSATYYGFRYGVKATVTREYSINQNACVLDEKLTLDLGEGVVLEDTNREVVTKGCS